MRSDRRESWGSNRRNDWKLEAIAVALVWGVLLGALALGSALETWLVGGVQ